MPSKHPLKQSGRGLRRIRFCLPPRDAMYSNLTARVLVKLLGHGGAVFCLVQWGMGGMDPYGSPYSIPNNGLQNPIPHSLLRTRQYCVLGVASGSRDLPSHSAVAKRPNSQSIRAHPVLEVWCADPVRGQRIGTLPGLPWLFHICSHRQE